MNTLLQSFDAGPLLPWTFLVWDGAGQPFTNIGLARPNARLFRLRRGMRTVGHVRIDAPASAADISISPVFDATIPTPLIGLGPGGAAPPLTQICQFQLDLGMNPAEGCYATTFELNNGNSWTLFVGVPTGAACGDG